MDVSFTWCPFSSLLFSCKYCLEAFDLGQDSYYCIMTCHKSLYVSEGGSFRSSAPTMIFPFLPTSFLLLSWFYHGHWSHSGENPEMIRVTPPLDGGNYHSWCRGMKRALLFNNKLKFLDGRIERTLLARRSRHLKTKVQVSNSSALQ